MCTVTVIATGTDSAPGLRIACNRDESRKRPAALPPQQRRFGSRTALLPIDPQGGGTWIAVNDAGLALSLLNFNPPVAPPRPPEALSRGLIIPGLLHLDSLRAAAQSVAAMDCRRYPPFRLVLIDRGAIGQAIHDGARLQMTTWPFDGRPQFFTSSGLGDHLVDAPRRALFREFFDGSAAAAAAQQDAFHRHSWPDRPHLSVCVRRDEARTVSLTLIEIGAVRIELTYLGDAPDSDTTPARCALAPATSVR